MAFYFWSMVLAISMHLEAKHKDFRFLPTGFAAIGSMACTGIGVSWLWQTVVFVLVTAIGWIILKKVRKNG